MIAKKFLKRLLEDRKCQDLFLMRNCRFDHDKRRTDEQVVINESNNTAARVLKEKAYNGRIKQKLEFLEGVSGFLI